MGSDLIHCSVCVDMFNLNSETNWCMSSSMCILSLCHLLDVFNQLLESKTLELLRLSALKALHICFSVWHYYHFLEPVSPRLHVCLCLIFFWTSESVAEMDWVITSKACFKFIWFGTVCSDLEFKSRHLIQFGYLEMIQFGQKRKLHLQVADRLKHLQ